VIARLLLPFFGPNASEQEYPPPQFLIDYAEFYRSYKIAFLYWLENYGDSASKEASEAKFRTLIRSLGGGRFQIAEVGVLELGTLRLERPDGAPVAL